MSKKRKTNRSHKPPARAATRNRLPTGVLVALLLTAVLVGLWFTRSRPPAATEASSAPGKAGETNLSKPASTGRPEFQKLIGKWVRPDGGYLLDIRGVDHLGVLDAAYFNPDPIHVSKAIALREEGTTRVYVELQDVNYPGCTYTLVHDPAADRLAGDYFQAAVREHYEVEFTRRP